MAADRSKGPTVLFVHAHPDDEAILTGACLAKAHHLGFRTIVAYGTRGDAGETEAELGGETLGERRAREATAACAELGVTRLVWLGYADSGMAGTPTNDHPRAFGRAPLGAVVDELGALLDGEEVLAVVGYDANGTYGHPDHLQVHRVGHALAARLAAPWTIEATYDREYLATLPDSDGRVEPTFASSPADLTHYVQGEAWFRAKMEAVKHHDSQAPRNRRSGTRRGIDAWRARFGTEWFIVRPTVTSPATARTAADLGPLGALFEPRASWPGPLTRPGV